MPYRNKTYICFDADSDIRYYRLMQAWKRSDHVDFGFFDAHELNNLMRGSSEATIKAKLRERLTNAKLFIVLIGSQTRYLYRFVRWEMEQALDRGLPIVAANLNGLRYRDDERCPPIIRDALAVHVSFNAAIIQHAMDNWPSEHASRSRMGETGAFYYSASVYGELGL